MRYCLSMQTDTLFRRSRYAKPQPKDRIIAINERDLRIFEAIHRHGPLPTHYLFELAKGQGDSFNAFKHRLTQLYNGTLDGKRYLLRPKQQYAAFNARYQYLVYELHSLSEVLLAENGRFSPYICSGKGHWVHQFMAACVSASMELAALKSGHRFIGKHEIFARSSCPESTRQMENPLALPHQTFSATEYIVPDDLFGIEYAGIKPKYRFLAVEIDRNTESVERSNLRQSSFGRKIHAYLKVMRSRSYSAHWGIRNLRMCTVTTNRTHLRHLCAFVQKHVDAEFAGRFVFHAEPDFGSTWRIPPVMYDLLSRPWMQGDGGLFHIDHH